MRLPLPPRQAELLSRPAPNTAPNLSLRFDHGYGGYDKDWHHTAAKKKETIEGKTAFLRDFVAAFKDPQSYDDFLDRRRAALAKAHCVTATSSAALLAGIGRWNPTEIGFTLDRLTGCPYVPGSSVKGLLREASKLVARGEIGHEETAAAYWRENRRRIFGRDATEAPNAEEREAGLVCLFDAYPTRWPALEVDVLTPHQGKYYTGTAPSPPGDWTDPIPVHFLRIAANCEVAFWFAPCRGTPLTARDREEIEALLVLALDWLGLGAKTASGYGWFMSPETAAEMRTSAPPRAAAPVKAAPVSRVEWNPARLTWIAGSGTLRADFGKEHTETNKRDAIEALPPNLIEALKNPKRKKPLLAIVVLERQDNYLRIVEVRELPPATDKTRC
ncbi:MAG TPA: type III-B CRISPR module RAMP protein Cmr6 [Thermoanaerobaculia bacterium]|jgi:CRISPR-associated protein Cmr6